MKTNILIIGRNALILETVLRLINSQPSYHGSGATTDEEALKLFERNAFDLVLIGGGVDVSSETMISEMFRKKNPSIKIIRHYGGGSGLLFNEIQEALLNKQIDNKQLNK